MFKSALSRVSLVAASVLLAAAPALAQEKPWPQERPLKIVVAAPAGYSPDLTARALADSLRKVLGQTVLVENKPGGLGHNHWNAFSAAKADGYTFSLSFVSATWAKALFKSAPYDIATDVEPISTVTHGVQILVANPNAGIDSVQKLIERAKTASPPLQYASQGIGSASHISSELLQRAAGTKLEHVPFPGDKLSGAIVRGDVPVSFSGVLDVLPYVKEGKLKALAIMGSRRIDSLPDVPSIVELGYPAAFVDVWGGLVAPKGTPKDIIVKMNEALQKVTQDPQYIKNRTMAGSVARYGNTEEMRARIQKDVRELGDLVRSAGIRPE